MHATMVRRCRSRMHARTSTHAATQLARMHACLAAALGSRARLPPCSCSCAQQVLLRHCKTSQGNRPPSNNKRRKQGSCAQQVCSTSLRHLSGQQTTTKGGRSCCRVTRRSNGQQLSHARQARRRGREPHMQATAGRVLLNLHPAASWPICLDSRPSRKLGGLSGKWH